MHPHVKRMISQPPPLHKIGVQIKQSPNKIVSKKNCSQSELVSKREEVTYIRVSIKTKTAFKKKVTNLFVFKNLKLLIFLDTDSPKLIQMSTK